MCHGPIGKIHLRKQLKNSLEDLLASIDHWKDDITIGVESTFNWYWLIDGLKTRNIPAYLGHALYIKRTGTQKHKTDSIDARQIADLLRVDRFPLAYAYPVEMRTIRDLLRRRYYLVRCRAAAYVHIQDTSYQHGYFEPTTGKIKNKATRHNFPPTVTDDTNIRKLLFSDLTYIESLDPQIDDLEKYIRAHAKKYNQKQFTLLQTISGCGPITALTVLYEMHTTDRFKSAQCFSSYCRVVRAANESADKDYGHTSNDKIGNPYLKWALSEIAVQMVGNSMHVKTWFDKQAVLYGTGGAYARLRHKLAVTIYQMLKHNECFDVNKFLGIHQQEQEVMHSEQWIETSERKKSEPKLAMCKPPVPSLLKTTARKKRSIKKAPGQVPLPQTGNYKVQTESISL